MIYMSWDCSLALRWAACKACTAAINSCSPKQSGQDEAYLIYLLGMVSALFWLLDCAQELLGRVLFGLGQNHTRDKSNNLTTQTIWFQWLETFLGALLFRINISCVVTRDLLLIVKLCGRYFNDMFMNDSIKP